MFRHILHGRGVTRPAQLAPWLETDLERAPDPFLLKDMAVACDLITEAVRSPIGRRGGGLSTIHPADLLGAVQAEAVRRAGVDPAEVDPARSIKELGMDSLTAMELAISIEERLGVSLFMDDFTGRETIAGLASAFLQDPRSASLARGAA